MTETEQHSLGWTAHAGNLWTRTVSSRPGDPPLLLRVFPNLSAGTLGGVWIWEVVDPCGDDLNAAAEIDNGEAGSCAAAMAAALSEALANIAWLADE